MGIDYKHISSVEIAFLVDSGCSAQWLRVEIEVESGKGSFLDDIPFKMKDKLNYKQIDIAVKV